MDGVAQREEEGRAGQKEETGKRTGSVFVSYTSNLCILNSFDSSLMLLQVNKK